MANSRFTGIETVARDARVSTATLYDLFPGKTQLFHAVMELRQLLAPHRRGDGP